MGRGVGQLLLQGRGGGCRVTSLQLRPVGGVRRDADLTDGGRTRRHGADDEEEDELSFSMEEEELDGECDNTNGMALCLDP